MYDSNDRKKESIRVIEDALWYNWNDTTTRGNYSYLPGTEVEVNKITELLDIKLRTAVEVLDQEYRIHKFVNYIRVDELIQKYGKEKKW